MTRARLLYLFFLGVVLLFSILYLPVFSVYLLVAMLLLPIILFGTVLAAGKKMQTEILQPPDSASPHMPFPCTILLQNHSRFPVSAAKLVMQWTHPCSGETTEISQVVSVPSSGTARLICTLQSEHCGAVRLQVTRIQVYDALRLFSRRCALPATQTICILPVIPTPPSAISLPEPPSESGMHLEEDPTEWAEVRPYRDGDSMRRIHWKLSSRSPELMVRAPEFSAPAPLSVCFFYSLKPNTEAPANRLDAMLEALFALTTAICSTGTALTVCISDGKQIRQAALSSAEELPGLLTDQLQETPGTSANDCFAAVPPALWETAAFCITDEGVPLPEHCVGFSTIPSSGLPGYHTIASKHSTQVVYEALGAAK